MSAPSPVNLPEILEVSAGLLEQTIKYATGLEEQLKAAKQAPSVILEKVASVDKDRLAKTLDDMRAAGLLEPASVAKVASAVVNDPVTTLLDVVDRLTAIHSLSDTPVGVGIRKESSLPHKPTGTRQDEDPDGWYKLREGS